MCNSGNKLNRIKKIICPSLLTTVHILFRIKVPWPGSGGVWLKHIREMTSHGSTERMCRERTFNTCVDIFVMTELRSTHTAYPEMPFCRFLMSSRMRCSRLRSLRSHTRSFMLLKIIPYKTNEKCDLVKQKYEKIHHMYFSYLNSL